MRSIVDKLKVKTVSEDLTAIKVAVLDVDGNMGYVDKSSLEGSQTLAETLTIDNKTNGVPIVSNDGTASVEISDSGNIVMRSDFNGVRQIVMAEDELSFQTDVRIDVQGKGINMATTSDGFGPPRLTTTQMNAIVSPTDGMLVKNTTAGFIYEYNLPTTTWRPLSNTTGTVTSVSSANADIGVASGTTTPVLTLNSGSGANQIVKRDGSGNIAGYQPLDADLTDIAALSPPNDNFIQRKVGVWVSRTIAQVKTDLAINNVDNTADTAKPVSTAQQTAIDAKVQNSLAASTTIAPSSTAVNNAIAAIPAQTLTTTLTAGNTIESGQRIESPDGFSSFTAQDGTGFYAAYNDGDVTTDIQLSASGAFITNTSGIFKFNGVQVATQPYINIANALANDNHTAEHSILSDNEKSGIDLLNDQNVFHYGSGYEKALSFTDLEAILIVDTNLDIKVPGNVLTIGDDGTGNGTKITIDDTAGRQISLSATNGATLNGNIILTNANTTDDLNEGSANLYASVTEKAKWNAGGVSNYQHAIFAPTTGGTVTLVNNQYNIINPTGALLALTVTLPASPSNNDVVQIKYTQSVSTVTYSGGTVVGGLTSATGGTAVTTLVYDSGTNKWY